MLEGFTGIGKGFYLGWLLANLDIRSVDEEEWAVWNTVWEL